MAGRPPDQEHETCIAPLGKCAIYVAQQLDLAVGSWNWPQAVECYSVQDRGFSLRSNHVEEA